MVGSVSARPPGVAIKAATTLDILSGGRAWFGLGAGWYEREARGLGLPWPDRPERFALLEETLQLAHQAWGGDRSAFTGRTIEAREPIVSPAPLSTPHPRILIGGVGERRTLRLVARYADACNILVPDPGESQRKLDVLLRHCEAVGRDPAEIETTALLEVDLERETTGDFIERLREQAREGIEHVIVNMPDAHDPRRLATFGREIIPAVTDVRPSGWPARPGREGSLAAPA
jgi:alkanesulfonate monooxygenase SsuD/methylene tetrahydromethanopterin reductase-like flavin-dependent oxidoreductase (luciferase family)